MQNPRQIVDCGLLPRKSGTAVCAIFWHRRFIQRGDDAPMVISQYRLFTARTGKDSLSSANIAEILPRVLLAVRARSNTVPIKAYLHYIVPGCSHPLPFVERFLWRRCGETFRRAARPLQRQPRNRTLTDVVAARDAALRLARFEALAGLFLLVRGQDRLAAEFDTLLLGVGPASCCAL